MQAQLNNNSIEQEHLEGETIAFYGDLISVNKEDVDFYGSVTKDDTVLSFVTEHQDDKHFTLMYPQESRSELFSGLHEKIININPNTQFMQISSIEEFANYYDNGSKEMDREKYPVESVKMLAEQDVLFYDVKERVDSTISEEKQPIKEYVKLSQVGYLGLGEELARISKEISSWTKEEFKENVGFEEEVSSIDFELMSLQLQAEIDKIKFNDFATTVVESVSMPAKKATDLVTNTIEKLYNLAKDKDVQLEAEFECSTNECKITGFNLVEIAEKSKEVTQENKINEKVDISDSNSTEKKENIAENAQDQANTFDTTIAAQETLAQLNLTDISQSNEITSEVEMA